MIDAENEIFTIVATSLRDAYPGLYVTGEYVREPAKFPCVSIEEKNNAVWRNSRDTMTNENHAAVMYEINVYSSKLNGKKQECKDILAVADGVMTDLGFSRTMISPVPNLADATIYRLTARYQAIIGTDVNGRFIIYKR